MDELKSQVPAEWQPIVEQFGPAFLKMTAQELWAWILLAAKGDGEAAYRAVLEKLPNADLVAQWGDVSDAWHTANVANAERIQWQKDAAQAILKVLVGIALAAVGL
jgi:hypothetical protein